ncbi:hypothetical protein [Paenibacillus sp. FSL P4-0502]|uniref:hypothetical protein n=1 Tax=Paenibacillus sp. FSL P4-0502 TaxID=2975319 RepID=UPI0030FC205C
MFKIVNGNLYTPQDMITFLGEMGIENPTRIVEIIKKKGLGLVGNLRIMYVQK